jgi:hypothetical protein
MQRERLLSPSPRCDCGKDDGGRVVRELSPPAPSCGGLVRFTRVRKCRSTRWAWRQEGPAWGEGALRLTERLLLRAWPPKGFAEGKTGLFVPTKRPGRRHTIAADERGAGTAERLDPNSVGPVASLADTALRRFLLGRAASPARTRSRAAPTSTIVTRWRDLTSPARPPPGLALGTRIAEGRASHPCRGSWLSDACSLRGRRPSRILKPKQRRSTVAA